MNDALMNLLSKADLLIVFIGMAALLWRVIHALDTLATAALQRQQQAPAPSPPPLAPVSIPGPKPTPPLAAPPPPAAPPLPPAPAVPPVMLGPFASYPKWFQWSVNEIGFHEVGNNQGLDRYIGLAKTGAEGDAWCAIFANAALEASGIMGSRSPSSQSFRTNPNFVQLDGPAPGALVVFWRGSQDGGQGHAGFYRGEDANNVWTLGGNENDMVQIEALPKSSASFGLIGYWWPKSIPLPAIGPVLMPIGSPTSVTTKPGTAVGSSGTPGIQTNIVATYFGGAQSAYGPPIDDNSLGVALPFRFPSPRPRVRVTGVKNGVSVECDIVDLGPWNLNDPYWLTGTRPQAESGYDLGQLTRGVPRKTNGAGIDLTLAAAKALGIDGKGLVNWQFIATADASAPAPNVT